MNWVFYLRFLHSKKDSRQFDVLESESQEAFYFSQILQLFLGKNQGMHNLNIKSNNKAFHEMFTFDSLCTFPATEIERRGS